MRARVANALVSKLILESGGVAEGELVDVVVPAVAAKTADGRRLRCRLRSRSGILDRRWRRSRARTALPAS